MVDGVQSVYTSGWHRLRDEGGVGGDWRVFELTVQEGRMCPMFVV